MRCCQSQILSDCFNPMVHCFEGSGHQTIIKGDIDRWRGGHGKMEGFDHWHCENWLWCSTNDIVSRLQFPHLESASLEMDSVATEGCLFHSIYPLEFIFTFSISARDDMTPLCCGVVTCCVTLISNISSVRNCCAIISAGAAVADVSILSDCTVVWIVGLEVMLK